MSFSDDKHADIIDAFNTTSRYLDNIPNLNNFFFDNMLSQINPSELQRNKANTPGTDATYLAHQSRGLLVSLQDGTQASVRPCSCSHFQT